MGPNEWVEKTADEITRETGLSYKQQVTARETLVSSGVIEQEYIRLEHRMRFRILPEALCRDITPDTADEDYRLQAPAKREDGELPKGKVAPAKREGGTCQKGSSSNNGNKEERQKDSFGAFWCAYPRKVAKKAALKAWLKVDPDDATVKKIMRSLAAFKVSNGWVKDGGQYIPHPATWLNGERWDDEVTPANGAVVAPAQDPDVLVIGFFRLTKDTPPRREQFETQGTYETYLSAWRKHFKQYE